MQSRPILVLGAKGQVAHAFAYHEKIGNNPIVCVGRPQIDLTILSTLQDYISALRPCFVINTAAYTAVEQAEKKRAIAFALNREGAGNVARVCCENQIPLIHLSTDYVFDGSMKTPYRETDPIAPLNIYGASKAAGEDAVRQNWPCHLIIRTSWIYSLYGHNFLNTMLRLGKEREEISIVDDQCGTPTWAGDLVTGIAHIVARILDNSSCVSWGTYHFANRGQTTWFGFALEIFRLLHQKGIKSPVLKSIQTSEFPSEVQRPKYSVLDTTKIEQAFGVSMPNWQVSLGKCLASLDK